MKYKHNLTDTWFSDLPETFEAMIGTLPKEKPNRSLIGKKAYKTFLKNGGSRNSKGQFSKKQETCLDQMLSDYLEQGNFNGSLTPRGELLCAFKVFQKHGLISKEVEI